LAEKRSAASQYGAPFLAALWANFRSFAALRMTGSAELADRFFANRLLADRSVAGWLLPVEAEGGVALFEQAIAFEHSICIHQSDRWTARVLGDNDGFLREEGGGGFGEQVERLCVSGGVFPWWIKVNQGEVLLTAGECSQGDRHAALVELEAIADAERGEVGV
jgi:hypothetical protein